MDALVAVIVSVNVPLGVAGFAVVIVSADVPPPFRNVGLNDAEVEGGSPVTLSETVSLKPPLGVTFTLNESLRPRFTTIVPGVAARAKSGSAADVTVSDTLVEFAGAPAASVAVIVSAYVPGDVDAPVVTVRVLEPPPFA